MEIEKIQENLLKLKKELIKLNRETKKLEAKKMDVLADIEFLELLLSLETQQPLDYQILNKENKEQGEESREF